MRGKTWLFISGALTVMLGVQLACQAAVPTTDGAEITTVPSNTVISDTATSTIVASPVPSETPTATEMPTSTPMIAPIPTLAVKISPPAEGKGNVVGLIVWNNTPAPQAAVKLCEEFTSYKGCDGINYSTYTDDNGYYVFKNVTPGSYVVITNVTGTGWWIYAIKGNNPRKETVAPNQTLTLDAQSIFKVDLRVTSPGFGKVVSEANPTFKWNAYPGAAYYQVTVTGQEIYPIVKDERTEKNEYTISKSLLNCEYQWEVEAFNDQGIKISSTKDSQKFIVNGQAASCNLELKSPQNKSKIGSKGLELSWKAHPLAGHYMVYVFDNNYKSVVSEKIAGDMSTFTIPNTIKSGTYRWYVVGYDKDDVWIAVSKWFTFTFVGE